MSDARELLEIAADYVSAQQFNRLAGTIPGDSGPGVDLDAIAERFDEALTRYVQARRD